MRKFKYAWTKQRWLALERDDFTCQYCGQRAPDVTLHVDHKVPVVDGGTDDLENLVTACAACNLGREAARFKTPVPYRKPGSYDGQVRRGKHFIDSLTTKGIELWKSNPMMTNKEVAIALNCKLGTARAIKHRMIKEVNGKGPNGYNGVTRYER